MKNAIVLLLSRFQVFTLCVTLVAAQLVFNPYNEICLLHKLMSSVTTDLIKILGNDTIIDKTH